MLRRLQLAIWHSSTDFPRQAGLPLTIVPILARRRQRPCALDRRVHGASDEDCGRRIGTDCIPPFPRTLVNYFFADSWRQDLIAVTADCLFPIRQYRVIRKMQEKGPIMSCPSCYSPMNSEFTAEINIHFPGLSGLDKPTIWVFPRLSLCLGCGSAQFKIPDAELKQLQTR